VADALTEFEVEIVATPLTPRVVWGLLREAGSR